jgi:hypothetical protein
MHRLTSKLSYANVVGSLALFVALGGVSYAAVTLPRNSVGTGQLKASAVTGAKIKDGSVTLKDLDSDAKLGTRGPQGAKGDVGTAGRDGSPGTPGAAGKD